MDVAERQRLEKLLGMLGSTFDGERANAARMIANMAEKKNVPIAEFVLGSAPVRVVRPTWTETPAQSRRASRSSTAAILKALQSFGEADDELEFTLTAWEFQFAADVSGKYHFDYELSDKQLAAAQRIIDKVEKSRERTGQA